MTNTPHKFSTALLLLLIALGIRGLLLEHTDLIDPTESRYANIAQEMLVSGDWLTPKVHMPEGVVPYLGKPPLHFWLTAAFYKIFGMEEWTSRLASFFSALGLVFLIFTFCKKYFDEETAIISGLIAFSSCMLFFLSGASVTDVTLSVFVSASLVCLYKFVRERQDSPALLYSAVVFAGLSFLCKGPVALVLIFLPFVLHSLVSRDFAWLKRVNWLLSSILFLAVISPWFIASEIANPGFLKYFIWNENIGRYLFKEYGDRYGSGHVYTHGSSWIMFSAAFFPWTLVLIFKFFQSGVRSTWNFIAEDQDRLFVFCWAVSAPLFFTFVRQLHAMYLLPAIPAAAILTSILLKKKPVEWTFKAFKCYSIISVMFLLALMVTCQILFEFSNQMLLMLIVCYLISVAYIWQQSFSIKNVQVVSSIFVFFVSFYFVGIICVTPYINKSRSTEDILLELSENSIDRKDYRKVGVVTSNIYSHYWTALAWETELKSKIDIEYLDPQKAGDSNLEYLLIEDNKHFKPETISKNFKLAIDKGNWKLFKRRDTL